jgi:uncharacterized protein
MKHVLLIQGAGAGAYEEDKILADSLRRALGPSYEVHYPAMPNEDDAPYDEWAQQIERKIAELQEPIMLVGHSVGASVLMKYLSETEIRKPVAGIFSISNPFWGGDGWRYEGWEELALPPDLPAKLPNGAAIFLYHTRDDEVVPFDHLALYAQALPHATVRERNTGGHQFNNDLSVVADDIRSLQ